MSKTIQQKQIDFEKKKKFNKPFANELNIRQKFLYINAFQLVFLHVFFLF